MGNRQSRRHAGKPHGMSYADQLARQRMLKEAAQNAAENTMVDIKADIKAEKVSMLLMLSLNDEFQFGQSRYERLSNALINRSKWYDHLVAAGDEEYAADKLRQEVERVTRQEVDLAWDERLREAQKRYENEKETNFERLRSSPEKLATTFCNLIECDKCPGWHLCNHTDGKANGLLKWLKQEAEK